MLTMMMMLNYHDDNLLQEWGCGACHWKTRGWDQPWRNPGKVDFHNLIADYWTFSHDQKKMIEST